MYRIECENESGTWNFHPKRLEWVSANSIDPFLEMSKTEMEKILPIAKLKSDNLEIYTYKVK